MGWNRRCRVAVAIWLTAAAWPLAAELLPVGSVAPDFTLTALDGRPVTLAEHRGQPVVVEFWASWCGPCRRQVPQLNELYERYRDRVVFLMVNTAEAATVVRRFVERFPVPGTVLLDPDDRVGELYGTRVLPSLVVVDGAGRIQAAHAGAVGDLDALLARLVGAGGTGGAPPTVPPPA